MSDVTAQPTRDQREMWRQIATDAGDDPYVNTLHPGEVLALLDQLDRAEARIEAWEKQYSQVLDYWIKVGETAVARIKAVEDLCDTAPDDECLDPLSAHYSAGYELALQDVRRALEGERGNESPRARHMGITRKSLAR